jgi:MSHA biogenesis protein MshO
MGFTLIEAIMVMTITAVLAAGVAVFLRKPVDGYFDLARRTELSDIADTAVRRISRDLHLALPNSVRVDKGPLCVEFIPTINGGRYRADVDSAGGGNVFSTASTSNQFDILGPLNPLNPAPAVNDRVVVYNLGIPGADAYAGDNIATIDAVSPTLIHWTPSSFQFPFTSPGNRFHLISSNQLAVTYVCTAGGIDAAGNGTGALYRLTGYAVTAAQAACPATPVAGTPLLAQNLTSCSFTYTTGVAERSGLVSIRLGITKKNETVTLYQDVHVTNVP